MEPTTYAEILAANMRAARARRGLDQEMTAARMRALGFSRWRYQTVGVAEKGKRRLTAEEVMALAWALETNIYALMAAGDDGEVQFPSGGRISARSVALLALAHNDRSVTWDGEHPEFTPDKGEIIAQVVIRPLVPAPDASPDPAFGGGSPARRPALTARFRRTGGKGG